MITNKQKQLFQELKENGYNSYNIAEHTSMVNSTIWRSQIGLRELTLSEYDELRKLLCWRIIKVGEKKMTNLAYLND